ncbi:MAG: flagellar biosynthesis protein FlhF [Deltaproteobacteria bacterium]|nr:flagellar biosynthesis protein FlhF [Deltaproteobacteria bacterium]
MLIRKFEAEDTGKALAAVKEAMGADAVIIATRTVRRGSLFGRPQVEVTAALDEPSPAPTPLEARDWRPRPHDEVLEVRLKSLRDEIQALRAAVEDRQPLAAAPYLREQLDDVRRLLLTLGGAGAPRPEPLNALLTTAGVCAAVAERVSAAAGRQGCRELGTDISSRRVLEAVVAQELTGTPPEPRRIIAVVGPTGVGKTTTLAKLAANAALVDHKRVGLITVDTYRVGGIDQLRTYGELIKVGMQVARDPKSFRRALERHADCDLVFVDTAGRGPTDAAQMTGLATMFAEAAIEVHLVIAAPTPARELQRILHRFEALRCACLLFTKLDEAVGLTALLNAAGVCHKPLSHVTFGQRVPEDIEVADPAGLAVRLVDGLVDLVPAQKTPPHRGPALAAVPISAEATL